MTRLTRGRVLSLLAVLPAVAAATTGIAAAADDSGGTKAKFKYVNRPGVKGENCIGCALFRSPAACTLVKGRISPNGYCIAWAAKAA
jgi:hypothetical protein